MSQKEEPSIITTLVVWLQSYYTTLSAISGIKSEKNLKKLVKTRKKHKNYTYLTIFIKIFTGEPYCQRFLMAAVNGRVVVGKMPTSANPTQIVIPHFVVRTLIASKK